MSTLIKKQFDCVSAADGCEVLKIAKSGDSSLFTLDGLPNFILKNLFLSFKIDVMMPNMDGL